MFCRLLYTATFPSKRSVNRRFKNLISSLRASVPIPRRNYCVAGRTERKDIPRVFISYACCRAHSKSKRIIRASDCTGYLASFLKLSMWQGLTRFKTSSRSSRVSAKRIRDCHIIVSSIAEVNLFDVSRYSSINV